MTLSHADLLSEGVLTTRSKISHMVNSLWMPWTHDKRLKGKKWTEKTLHFHFALFIFFAHLFFPPPWTCHPSQGRRSRPTNEPEAILNKKQLKVFFGLLNMEMLVCPTVGLFSELFHVIHLPILGLFGSHCISASNVNSSMCGILCLRVQYI